MKKLFLAVILFSTIQLYSQIASPLSTEKESAESYSIDEKSTTSSKEDKNARSHFLSNDSSLRDYEYPFLTNYILTLNPNLSFVNNTFSNQSLINNTSSRSTAISLDARFSLMSNRKYNQTELLVFTNNSFRRNNSKGSVDIEEKINNTTSYIDFKTKSFYEGIFLERAFTYAHHHKYYIEKGSPGGGGGDSSNILAYEKWYRQEFAPQFSVGKGRTHIVTYLIIAKKLNELIFNKLGVNVYADNAGESKFADEIARIRTKNNGINRFNSDYQRNELINLLRKHNLTAEQILVVLPKLEDCWFNDIIYQRLRGASFSLGFMGALNFNSRVSQNIEKKYGNSFICSIKYFFPISTKTQFDLRIDMNLFQKEYDSWEDFLRYPSYGFKGRSQIAFNVDFLYFVNAQTSLQAYFSDALSIYDETENPSANNTIMAGLTLNRFITNQIQFIVSAHFTSLNFVRDRRISFPPRTQENGFSFRSGFNFYLF